MNKMITSYTPDQLQTLVKELGQPAFRAKQIQEWIYVKKAADYDAMTNLPAALRESLKKEHPLLSAKIASKQVSKDGTRKYLIEFTDGNCVETVAIPSENGERITVCFSTQVGCPMECSFCATGMEGFKRNLEAGEIVEQVLLAEADMGQRVSNLVAMGQGEPFLNYSNVMDALRILNNPKGMAIGARHISVSTCGIIDGIDAFADEKEQFTLAISLHSAVQDIRNALMPKTNKQKLNRLKAALGTYVDKTNRRVTLEYLMAKDVNDSEEDLEALKQFCRGLLCHVNIIPLNKVEGSSLVPSSKATVDKWVSDLQKFGIETTVRNSKGSDISGACGQLKETSGR